MTADTIITAGLIITNIIALLLLACALERNGLLKQESTTDSAFKAKWIARLEADVESRQQAVNEWRLAANVLREDNRALEAGNRYLRARQRLVRTAWWRRRQKRSLYPAYVVLTRLP